MLKTDVLVVGAGPAGSIAARNAAENGAEVILIDKMSEIGTPKRCAEGISAEGLKRVNIKPKKAWITNEITGVRLVSPNNTSVWLTADKVKFPEAGYILERKIFDKYLAMEAARSGAKIKVKTIARGIDKKNDDIIVHAYCMDEKIDIKTKIVIAADGPESRVARWFGLKTHTKVKDMISAAQFEMVNVDIDDSSCIEFYFGNVAPGGYAWIFPKSDDVANVGLGVLNTKTKKSAYEHLLSFVKENPATKNAQPVEFNVGGVPVAGMHKNLVADGLMVVGDAAGQVNPLTGGGLVTGMVGGMLAGKVAAEAIDKDDNSEKMLKKYEELCKKEIGEEIDKYLKVKNYLLSLSDEELDSIAEAFKDIEFDKVSTRELVKKLIKVSPKALVKLGKLI
ncbi:2,3-di-O-geranylgeranylglyceryl phosphate reductase [Methanothermus fervidus DSM 2088]|uniref:Digeranylgeranylglycerophospholipid reductase n=1 Tax=Methanothermus fervidus (strain ATCC 43054 / DSM 2088 / JCM 10308 / V24 S) TaxID=523846 RepID=E3GWT9_METFV|nr:NAD(P)/FAD-dependent oxidoreductase [Methanothermus fervidus]ADP78008.1 2,3-di-O-geranylgeranylglyceryl phosphate reductase [Methanothermus fervidus DSM 2088]